MTPSMLRPSAVEAFDLDGLRRVVGPLHHVAQHLFDAMNAQLIVLTGKPRLQKAQIFHHILVEIDAHCYGRLPTHFWIMSHRWREFMEW